MAAEQQLVSNSTRKFRKSGENIHLYNIQSTVHCEFEEPVAIVLQHPRVPLVLSVKERAQLILPVVLVHLLAYSFQ